MLSQAELRTALHYDENTGVFTWRDYPLPSGKRRKTHGKGSVGASAGCPDKRGVFQVRYLGKLYLAHRLAWLYVFGWLPKEIDHINVNPSDNRIRNLRLATRAQQNANTRARATNKTGFKGVSRSKGKFAAHIRVSGKSIYLGSFNKPEEAHAAYVKAATEAHGYFARAA